MPSLRKKCIFATKTTENMDIDIKEISIRDLRPNNGEVDGLPRNPRKISKKNLEKLKKSVQDAPEMLRLRELIVVPHGDGYVVIAGNQRLEAAKAVGMETLPCKVLPEDTDPAKLREYAIKDNLPFGEDDWEVMASDWDTAELEEWGMVVPEKWKDNPTAEEDDFDADSVKETVCKKGDIWQLGDHRLMCGDSTDAASFALLMDGEKADIAFTSPPYNMQASNIAKVFDSDKVKDSYGIKNGTYNEFSDNLSNDDYAKLLNGALDCCLANADEVLFNLGILSTSKFGIIDMLAAHKDKFSEVLVWNKNNCMRLCLPPQIHLLNHICELIFCFNQDGTRAFSHSQWELGQMNNRIDIGMQSNNEYSKVHHATFPVALPAYIIENFTEKSIIDCFGGTGTTLIAAEQLGRKCYMMELDPLYCDIIIARWEKLTGKKATKINNHAK